MIPVPTLRAGVELRASAFDGVAASSADVTVSRAVESGDATETGLVAAAAGSGIGRESSAGFWKPGVFEVFVI